MPTRTREQAPKVPLRPNTLQNEELDEPSEIPDKKMKQQQLHLSPMPSTTPYKLCDPARTLAASPPHTNGNTKIFSLVYREDAPRFESIEISVLVHGLGVLELRTYPDDTIESLKLQIETRAWIPAERQQLSYNGTILEHCSFQLSMYEIIDRSGLICREV